MIVAAEDWFHTFYEFRLDSATTTMGGFWNFFYEIIIYEIPKVCIILNKNTEKFFNIISDAVTSLCLKK